MNNNCPLLPRDMLGRNAFGRPGVLRSMCNCDPIYLEPSVMEAAQILADAQTRIYTDSESYHPNAAQLLANAQTWLLYPECHVGNNRLYGNAIPESMEVL
jgi:hypothetical protein